MKETKNICPCCGQHIYHGKLKGKERKIISLFTVKHLTTREIALIVEASAAAVAKCLKRNGITSDQGEWVLLQCSFCGADIKITRSNWRKSLQHYCSNNCYYASRENPGFKPWRQGQRLARAIVSQHIHLEPGWVVHHKDGDGRNNDLNNLAVYRSNGDHIKHHHNKHPVNPVWDGVNIR